MADNVTLNPGAGGAVVASDDIGSVQYQRIKNGFGDDGVYSDVSTTNPFPVTVPSGELVEAIEALRMTMGSLLRTIGLSLPDLLGRQRVVVDAITGGLTLSTITTVSTVSTTTTVGTVTNQSQMGGFVAADQIPALMHMSADNLRRNITVT
jgi:hypothetical protein